MTFERVLI